jgi:hypothetical protein
VSDLESIRRHGASNAHQKLGSTMDDTDNDPNIYRNNGPIFQMALVLLSANRSISVVYRVVGVLRFFAFAVR